jgi:ABC-type bacteriocin/lantibiotic exporter with double-glycine peptidase domain
MANCDQDTKKRFYQAITHDAPDKTVIVIAHDPLFLTCFERVLAMKQGEIVQDIRGKDIEAYRNTVIDNPELAKQANN